MAMLVVEIERQDGVPALGPEVLTRLAELGVSDVSLFSDGATVAMVVEGWAFDPRSSADETVAVLAPVGTPLRCLHPIARLRFDGTTREELR